MNLLFFGLVVLEVLNEGDGTLDEQEVAGVVEDEDVADGVEHGGVGGQMVQGTVGTMPTWGRESDV